VAFPIGGMKGEDEPKEKEAEDAGGAMSFSRTSFSQNW